MLSGAECAQAFTSEGFGLVGVAMGELGFGRKEAWFGVVDDLFDRLRLGPAGLVFCSAFGFGEDGGGDLEA